jgi:hypothetical protein
MELQAQEAFKVVQQSVERLANAQVFETSRAMFDLGNYNFKNGNPAVAVALLDGWLASTIRSLQHKLSSFLPKSTGA